MDIVGFYRANKMLVTMVPEIEKNLDLVRSGCTRNTRSKDKAVRLLLRTYERLCDAMSAIALLNPVDTIKKDEHVVLAAMDAIESHRLCGALFNDIDMLTREAIDALEQVPPHAALASSKIFLAMHIIKECGTRKGWHEMLTFQEKSDLVDSLNKAIVKRNELVASEGGKEHGIILCLRKDCNNMHRNGNVNGNARLKMLMCLCGACGASFEMEDAGYGDIFARPYCGECGSAHIKLPAKPSAS